MRWNDDLPDSWDAAPEHPPAVESDHEATMEKRPSGREGQELREVQTGAWLASSRVAPLSDAVRPSE